MEEYSIKNILAFLQSSATQSSILKPWIIIIMKPCNFADLQVCKFKAMQFSEDVLF